MNGNSIKFGKNYISLPKVGKIKADIHRKIPSGRTIKSATVSMEADGSYRVSLSCEYEVAINQYRYDDTNLVGFDYLSDGLLMASDGWCPDMPHWYRKAETRLRREQRKLSHMIQSHVIGYKPGPKGGQIPVYDKPLSECKNIQKQKQKAARLHRSVVNKRMDYLQKLSTEITNQYDGVCAETLNMRSMANKGFGNGKATLDNGYSMFLKMLEYKCRDRGKPFVKVDKWFPSSQLCSNCGGRHDMPLKVRTYECPKCGMALDRDLNAAINIKNEGLSMMMSGLWSYSEFMDTMPKRSKKKSATT